MIFQFRTQGACSQRRCGESPRAKLQRVSSEDRRTPVCGQAVKRSAKMRSALEFFATAQSCREGCQAYKNEVYVLPTELDEASQRTHREHSPNDVVGKVPVRSCRVSSEDSRTPVCGQAVKQSAEMQSALEFFATAQSCRERSLEKGLQERSLPIARRARLIVVKLRLPALGAVLTVFGTKNSSCVELECGTTPLVRGDSARSRLMGSQLG